MSGNQKRLLFWHLIGIGVFNKVDYILTLEFLKKGFYEANPLIATTIGTYKFPLIKLILIPLILLAIWQHNDKIRNSIAKLVWIPFLVYFSLMGYYSFLIIRSCG